MVLLELEQREEDTLGVAEDGGDESEPDGVGEGDGHGHSHDEVRGDETVLGISGVSQSPGIAAKPGVVGNIAGMVIEDVIEQDENPNRDTRRQSRSLSRSSSIHTHKERTRKVLDWAEGVDGTCDLRRMEDRWRMHVEQERERIRMIGRLARGSDGTRE